MEPACISVGAHRIWEPWSHSGDDHAPLRSGTFERARGHPLHPGAGCGCVRSSRHLLVLHGHHSRGAKVTGVPALHLRAVLCLLHVQRDLPAFHVSFPP